MGGTFVTENKVLPGSYVKFVSSAKANATLSERGVAAVLLPAEWNPGAVVEVTAETVNASLALFGFAPESEEMLPVREMLRSCGRVLVYTVGAGVAASSTVGRAKYAGERGNLIRVRVSQNPDYTAANMKMDVITTVDGVEVDRQIGVNAMVVAGEIQNNDFVVFDETATLDRPGLYSFTGGASTPVTVADYQNGLDRLESESFHSLVYGGESTDVRDLFAGYTRRMREECGAIFQCVLFGCDANYRGVVNAYDRASVYWIAGALAGCAVNRSLTHAEYNGECEIAYPVTQSEMIAAVSERKFAFYNVGGALRVLGDINSEDDATFGKNQVLRVLDSAANDIAALFAKQYLGRVQNDHAGRMCFWNDVVHLLNQLSELGALEDFSGDDVTVEEGYEKTAVTVTAKLCPVCGMEKLYLTVTVV